MCGKKIILFGCVESEVHVEHSGGHVSSKYDIQG